MTWQTTSISAYGVVKVPHEMGLSLVILHPDIAFTTYNAFGKTLATLQTARLGLDLHATSDFIFIASSRLHRIHCGGADPLRSGQPADVNSSWKRMDVPERPLKCSPHASLRLIDLRTQQMMRRTSLTSDTQDIDCGLKGQFTQTVGQSPCGL